MLSWKNNQGRRGFRPRDHRSAGQNTLEYVGLVLLVAGVVAALLMIVPGLGISTAFRQAICPIVHQQDSSCGGRDDGGRSEDGRGWPWDDGSGDGSGDGWDWPWEDDGSGDDGWNWPWENEEGDGDDDRRIPPEDASYEEKVEIYAQNTELGREALRLIERYDTEVRYRAGGGSYYSPSSNTIVIDSSLPPEQQTATLVHEANHLRYDQEDLSPDVGSSSRQEYIDGMVAEEARGTVLAIRSNQQAQREYGEDRFEDVLLQQEYEDAYDSAVARAEERAAEQGRTLTDAERERIGRAAGERRVVQAFMDGEVVTSTNGQTYPEYYGESWDNAH